VVDSATSGSAWYGREAANLMLPFTGFLCKDLLLTVFSTLDVDLCNRLRGVGQHGNSKASNNAAICRTCFKLTEHIDEYQARIEKTKESLVYRREKYVSVMRTNFNPHFGGVGGGGGGIFDDLDDGVIGQPIAKAKTEFPGDHHHHDHDGVMEDKYLPSVTLNITDGGGEGVPKQESPEDDIMADLMAAAANAGAGDSETERKIKLDPDAPFNPDFDLPDISYASANDEDDEYEPAPKKRRGRKKGSKNKPKVDQSQVQTRNFIKASDDPMTEGQKTRFKPDFLISPSKTSTQEETEAFVSQCPDPELARSILADLLEDIKDFQTSLPSKVDDQQTSVSWDLVQFKTEEPAATKHVVPGGLTCFECNLDFERIVDKVDHILAVHSEQTAYEVYGENSVESEGGFTSEKNAYEHATSCHDCKEPEPAIALKTPRDADMERIPGKWSCRHCPVVSTSKLGYWYHWWKRHYKYKHQTCPICQEETNANQGEVNNLGSATEFRRHFLFNHFDHRFRCPQCENFETQNKETIVRHMANHDDFIKTESDQAFPSKTMAPKSERKRKQKENNSKRGELQLGMNVCAPMALRKARANSKVPLNLLEKLFVNPDLGLVQPSTSSQLGMSSFPDSIKNHFHTQVEILKTEMPSLIDSQEACIRWGTHIYWVGSFKLTFGIPGEFTCFECGREFSEVSEKHAHILEEHTSPPPYSCQECTDTEITVTFQSESVGRSHMKSSHRKLQRPAPENDYDHDPIQHSRSQDWPFKCKFCSLTCSTEFAYWHHMASAHKMFKNGRCPDCRQVLVGVKSWRHHIMVTHAMQRFQCPECDEKIFNTALLFQRHIKTHMVKVKDSSEKEDANNKLSLHMAKRAKKEAMKCGICSMEIKNDNAFARHMMSMHEIKVAVTCKVCNMTLEDPRALEAHKKSEHGVGSCHYCGKSFFVKGDLIAHIEKIHEGKLNDKTYMCEICSKSFNTIFQLKTHKVIHKEKQLKCQLCPKAFHWKSSLEAHMMSCHMNNGPKKLHTCEFCGKSFADKSNYKSHRYTHTQEKPYNCDGCGKGFIRKDVLRTHKMCAVK